MNAGRPEGKSRKSGPGDGIFEKLGRADEPKV